MTFEHWWQMLHRGLPKDHAYNPKALARLAWDAAILEGEPDQESSEMPGMWELSDMSGGWADTEDQRENLAAIENEVTADGEEVVEGAG